MIREFREGWFVPSSRVGLVRAAGLLVVVMTAAVFLSGCRVSEFHVESDVRGIGHSIERKRATHVFFIHGMGGDYSEENCVSAPDSIIGHVAHQHGLNRVSIHPRHVTEGNIRCELVTHKYSTTGHSPGRSVYFHVWNWSPITEPGRGWIQFLEQAEPHIGWKLESMLELKQELVNNGVPDVAMYLGAYRAQIQRMSAEALLMAVNGEGKDLEPLKHEDDLSFITFSLGSQILFDAMAGRWADSDPAAREKLDMLRKDVAISLRSVFMVSNPLPLLNLYFGPDDWLQAGRAAPSAGPNPRSKASEGDSILDFFRQKAQVEGEKGTAREPTQMVMISDPNDLLSYSVPYYSNQIPANVQVISVVSSVAKWSIFGYVWAPKAHRGYAFDERVLDVLSNPSTPRTDWPDGWPEEQAERK